MENKPEGIGARAPKAPVCLCRSEGKYNSKFTHHSPSTCYWEVSEKYLPAQNHHENCRRVNCHCPDIEAPTDGGWEVLFDKIIPDTEGYIHVKSRTLKATIINLIQKERERTGDAIEMSKAGWIEEGKSEAFSLVKEIVKKMTREEKGYWGTERLKIFGWNGALTEFITRLSTLEANEND